ncbi:MAG: ribonuclease III domain-containing protein [Acholeplasma sp.]
MNGLVMAYLGDAYYELEIRRYLINQGITNMGRLHTEKVKFASNEAQASIMNYFLAEELLTDDEVNAYKKGRNKTHNARKQMDMVTYQQATGFESLIGYLSVYDQVRAKKLIQMGITFIKQGG